VNRSDQAPFRIIVASRKKATATEIEAGAKTEGKAKSATQRQQREDTVRILRSGMGKAVDRRRQLLHQRQVQRREVLRIMVHLLQACCPTLHTLPAAIRLMDSFLVIRPRLGLLTWPDLH